MWNVCGRLPALYRVIVPVSPWSTVIVGPGLVIDPDVKPQPSIPAPYRVNDFAAARAGVAPRRSDPIISPTASSTTGSLPMPPQPLTIAVIIAGRNTLAHLAARRCRPGTPRKASWPTPAHRTGGWRPRPRRARNGSGRRGGAAGSPARRVVRGLGGGPAPPHGPAGRGRHGPPRAHRARGSEGEPAGPRPVRGGRRPRADADPAPGGPGLGRGERGGPRVHGREGAGPAEHGPGGGRGRGGRGGRPGPGVPAAPGLQPADPRRRHRGGRPPGPHRPAALPPRPGGWREPDAGREGVRHADQRVRAVRRRRGRVPDLPRGPRGGAGVRPAATGGAPGAPRLVSGVDRAGRAGEARGDPVLPRGGQDPGHRRRHRGGNRAPGEREPPDAPDRVRVRAGWREGERAGPARTRRARAGPRGGGAGGLEAGRRGGRGGAPRRGGGA